MDDEYDLTDGDVLDTLEYFAMRERLSGTATVGKHSTTSSSSSPSLSLRSFVGDHSVQYDSQHSDSFVTKQMQVGNRDEQQDQMECEDGKEQQTLGNSDGHLDLWQNHNGEVLDRSSKDARPHGIRENGEQLTSLSSTNLAAVSIRISNPTPSRQKQELMYLKAKVRELELELKRTEQDNHDRLVREGDSMWQHVAQQQFVERQRSLQENARLKQQLAVQIKFSKNLERIIRKRPYLDVLGGSAASRHSHSRKRKLQLEALHDELTHSSARAYLRMEQVMRDSRLLKICQDHQSVDIKVQDDANGWQSMHLESRSVKRLPFVFQAVAKEYWSFLSNADNLNTMDGISRKVKCTENEIFATTILHFPVAERSAVLSAAVSIRRYTEEEFVALVWESHGECEAKSNGKNTFKVLETGWTLITALPDRPDACIIRSISHIAPSLMESVVSTTSLDEMRSTSSDSDAAEESSSAEIGILTEMILGAYQKTAGRIYTSIQNTLMEALLAESKPFTR